MNKNELIGKVAAEAGVGGAQAESVIAAFFSTVTEATKAGDKVTWPGFGTFQVKGRPARTGRNPGTGEAIEIAASNVMHFGPAAGLKTSLNS